MSSSSRVTRPVPASSSSSSSVADRGRDDDRERRRIFHDRDPLRGDGRGRHIDGMMQAEASGVRVDGVVSSRWRRGRIIAEGRIIYIKSDGQEGK